MRFKTGDESEYAANEIAENWYAMCDSTSLLITLLNIDAPKLCYQKNLLPLLFLVQWNVGESTWIPLKDLKKSNPIELAEYVLSRKIQDKPTIR